VASDLRRAGIVCTHLFRSSSLNAVVKELLNWNHIYRSYRKNSSGFFYLGHGEKYAADSPLLTFLFTEHKLEVP